MSFTTFYISGWPYFGRDVGEKQSLEYAELIADKLKAALPDYADFIGVGDQANQGDARILFKINQVFQANYKQWIADAKSAPVKESKKKPAKIQIRELGAVLPIEPLEKKPIIKNVNLRG